MFWACADVSSCIQGSKACRILHIFFLLSTGNPNTSFTFSCTFVGYVGKGKCADGLLIWHYSFNTLDSIHGSNKMLIPGWYVLHWVFKASIVNERLLVWYSNMASMLWRHGFFIKVCFITSLPGLPQGYERVSSNVYPIWLDHLATKRIYFRYNAYRSLQRELSSIELLPWGALPTGVYPLQQGMLSSMWLMCMALYFERWL